MTGVERIAEEAAGSRATSSGEPDEEAIRAAALDYIEGWYTGDPDRMERSLHPDLAKRIVRAGADGVPRLEQMSALTLIHRARSGAGRADPSPRCDVRILDRFENAASVRLDASGWVDFLHLVRENGRWRIVNVLWELRPETPR